jgi:hypothetical protein
VIVSNPNLFFQFSGAVIQCIANAIKASRDAELTLTNYWANLSIATAQDVDGTLNFVGLLCAFPRPLVGSIFFETNLIEFTDANIPQTSYTRTDLTFFASDNSVNTAGGNFIAAGFVAGQWLIISGSASNNYTTLINSVTASKMVLLTYPVVNESDSNSITLTIGNMTIGFDDANFPTPSNAPYVFNPAAGEFDTAAPLPTNVMPASWYKSILPIAAQLKWTGLTLAAIDALAEWANTNGAGTGYTISFNAYQDILVTFKTPIDERALTAINMLFTQYQTAPQVTAQQP